MEVTAELWCHDLLLERPAGSAPARAAACLLRRSRWRFPNVQTLRDDRMICRRENQILLATIFSIFTIYCLIVGLASNSISTGIVLVAMGCLSLVVGVRGYRAGLDLRNTQALVVRGVFRTRTIPQYLVEGCYARRTGLHGVVPILKLSDGSELPLYSLADPNPAFRQGSQRVGEMAAHIDRLLHLP